MSADLIISSVVQILLLIIILFSIRKRGNNHFSYIFWDANETNNVRGIFAVLIVLFHVPVSSVLYNLLGCVTFVLIVTCFSMFASYGIAYKVDSTNGEYLKKFPLRCLKIISAFLVVVILKKVCGFSIYSGGMNWIYILLVYYLFSFFLYKYLSFESASFVLAIGSVLYAVVGYFVEFPGGWHEQSLGFCYGIILYYLVKKKYALNKKINSILVTISFFIIFISGYFYIQIHDVLVVNLPMFIIRIIMSLAEIIILIIFSNYIVFDNRFFAKLGEISLYIYLVHGLVIDLLSRYFSNGMLIVCVEAISLVMALALQYVMFELEKIVWFLLPKKTY